jgi:hypothetical protein
LDDAIKEAEEAHRCAARDGTTPSICTWLENNTKFCKQSID